MDNYINEGNTHVNNLIEIIKSKLILIILIILNFLKENYNSFITFILDKNIMKVVISIFIGTQISTLASVINNEIINPIIERIFKKNNNAVNVYTFDIFGINFAYGKLIMILIQIFFSFIVIYIIWKMTSITDLSPINSFLNKLTTTILITSNTQNNVGSNNVGSNNVTTSISN